MTSLRQATLICRLSPAAVLGVAAVLSACALPASAAPPAPVEIGKAAPAFTLKDQAGTAHSLDDLRKQGPVALVFYRSAKW